MAIDLAVCKFDSIGQIATCLIWAGISTIIVMIAKPSVDGSLYWQTQITFFPSLTSKLYMRWVNSSLDWYYTRSKCNRNKLKYQRILSKLFIIFWGYLNTQIANDHIGTSFHITGHSVYFLAMLQQIPLLLWLLNLTTLGPWVQSSTPDICMPLKHFAKFAKSSISENYVIQIRL